MLLHIAESMAYTIFYPDRELELIPIRPFVGYSIYHRIETLARENILGEWSVEYIEEPLPNWYIADCFGLPFGSLF